MAKVDSLRRLNREDFPPEFRDLVDKLALNLNPIVEQLQLAFNKNINFENLSRETITISVENASGNLRIPTQFKTNLKSRILGINIIKAENTTNPSIYPIEAPWISWTIENNIITVKKVTGLQDNNKYNLTLEVIS